MLNVFYSDTYSQPWLKFVKAALDNLGMTFIFDTQAVNRVWFSKAVKFRLMDKFRQQWSNQCV